MNLNKMQKEFNRLNNLKRNHASFFNDCDQFRQELGVTSNLFNTLGIGLRNIKPGGDPPDIIVNTQNTGEIGIEVTELVNQKAIESSIRASHENRHRKTYFEDVKECTNEVCAWNKEIFSEELQEIIVKKMPIVKKMSKS